MNTPVAQRRPQTEALATIRSGLGHADPRHIENQGPDPGGRPRDIYLSDKVNPGEYLREQGLTHLRASTYDVVDGKLCVAYLRRKGGSMQFEHLRVADFDAIITYEIHDEYGNIDYQIEGLTRDGRNFKVTISSEDFEDNNKLRIRLGAAAGANSSVNPRAAKYLGEAIKHLTYDYGVVQKLTRLNRTGWHAGHFVIPGLETPGLETVLPPMLPHKVEGNIPLKDAREALDALIHAKPLEATLPALSAFLGAPMLSPADLQNESYGVFIQGETGTFKTTWMQNAMSIFGRDLVHDKYLIKWSDATANAMQALASHVRDLPFFVDNFKPNTGTRSAGMVELIHRMSEGSEKQRLDRNARLRNPQPIQGTLFVTGEDLPQSEPSTLARMLVLNFTHSDKQSESEALRRAQASQKHLCGIGHRLLSWLQSEAGQAELAKQADLFYERRRNFSQAIRQLNLEVANPDRLASNLALNQTTYEVLCQHPDFGDLFSRQRETYITGLAGIMHRQIKATREALPANIFVDALRELIASTEKVIIDRNLEVPPGLADRVIGYHDGKGGAYLLPDKTFRAIEQLRGKEALGEISDQALYAQLARLGYLASTDPTRTTRRIRVNGYQVRVLHVTQATFIGLSPDD
ncbi:MAG: DUF927 domain-containing protein [Anaerolineae bacterium]|nr:DUF927 domain-containing protein [Anaerolineae bacterium]